MALPTNIRLDWKGLPGTNSLALFNDAHENRYKIGPRTPLGLDPALNIAGKG